MPVHVMKEGFIHLSGEEGKTEETESVTSFEEWNQMAGGWPLKRLVAHVERSAGRHTGPEVHQPGDCAAPDLAGVCMLRSKRYARKAKEQSRLPFREGSKAAQVYALLCRPEGATARQIGEVTGWQRHSVRGFLSASLRKQGRKVRSFTRAGERVYRLKS